ncbi:MAG: hypothetical protein K8S54_03755 [Spirochaetia bacterium]|nr:hypothetical protein [Spirochaetia bacterium]
MKLEPDNITAAEQGPSSFNYSRERIQGSVDALTATIQQAAEQNVAAEAQSWEVAALDQSIIR